MRGGVLKRSRYSYTGGGVVVLLASALTRLLPVTGPHAYLLQPLVPPPCSTKDQPRERGNVEADTGIVQQSPSWKSMGRLVFLLGLTQYAHLVSVSLPIHPWGLLIIRR